MPAAPTRIVANRSEAKSINNRSQTRPVCKSSPTRTVHDNLSGTLNLSSTTYTGPGQGMDTKRGLVSFGSSALNVSELDGAGKGGRGGEEKKFATVQQAIYEMKTDVPPPLSLSLAHSRHYGLDDLRCIRPRARYLVAATPPPAQPDHERMDRGGVEYTYCTSMHCFSSPGSPPTWSLFEGARAWLNKAVVVDRTLAAPLFNHGYFPRYPPLYI